RIHQFGHDDPQFENAKVLPALVVFRNNPPSFDQTAVLTEGGNIWHPQNTRNVRIAELQHQPRWSARRHRQLSSEPQLRIGELIDVHRGIATGANEYFIFDRSKAKELGLPAWALRPLLPKARTLETDIIERGADGYPKVTQQLCVLDCDLNETQIASRS